MLDVPWETAQELPCSCTDCWRCRTSQNRTGDTPLQKAKEVRESAKGPGDEANRKPCKPKARRGRALGNATTKAIHVIGKS